MDQIEQRLEAFDGAIKGIESRLGDLREYKAAFSKELESLANGVHNLSTLIQGRDGLISRYSEFNTRIDQLAKNQTRILGKLDNGISTRLALLEDHVEDFRKGENIEEIQKRNLNLASHKGRIARRNAILGGITQALLGGLTALLGMYFLQTL